jgi:ABC-type transport system substrate-binding protein
VDEVILRPINDDTVRYTALRTGNVDWVWALPLELIPEIKRNPPPGIDFTLRGGARWVHLQLNYTKGPTKDLRVRQAVAYGVDKKRF